MLKNRILNTANNPWGKKRFLLKILFVNIFIILCVLTALGQDRFPRPEFISDYVLPETQSPKTQGVLFQYIDVLVLIILLSLFSYLVLKRRSRTGIMFCSLISIAYFGFWRKGCVCSIGSVQNITLSLFDPSYIVPVSVVLFFFAPILFTLFTGRTFCAGVCPFGALQDFVAIKPVKLPEWLIHVLSLIPVVYLGLAVLFAATGSDFIICRFDPFIGFFRLGAIFPMFIFGLTILVVGIFIARPYCRFICPYGVILGWVSRFSKYHLSITPDECITCSLCENACPVGAINTPSPESDIENRHKAIRRLVVVFILFPVIVFITGFSFSRLSTLLAKVHPTVRLASNVLLAEKAGSVDSVSDEIYAFKTEGISSSELYNEAKEIEKQFIIGTWFCGIFIGIAVWFKIVGLSVWSKRDIFEPNRLTCVSCGRCFEACPRELVRKVLGERRGEKAKDG